MEHIADLVNRILQNASLSPEQPQSSTESSYKCEACCDTGWIHYEKDGYSYSMPCECVKKRSAIKRIENSGLRSILDRCTFQSFRCDEPFQQTMKDNAIKYGKSLFCGDFEKVNGLPWFFVGGPPGCGKTHICTALCGKALRDYSMTVIYMRWIDEVRRLKAQIMEPEYDDMIAPYLNCDLLYIDDLFKGRSKMVKPSDAEIRIAFSIIDGRYKQNKPVIISSESSLDDLIEQVDEATFSRVWEKAKDNSLYITGTNRNYRMKGGSQ